MTNKNYGSVDCIDDMDGEFGAPRPTRTVCSVNGDFQGLCEDISNNIFTVNSNATSLDRLMKQIGSNKDSVQLRDRIHDTEQNTNHLTTDITQSFKQLSRLCSRSDRQQKLQFERLKSDFQETVKRYYGLQRKVADKVKSAEPLRNPVTENRPLKDLISWGEDADDEAGHMEQARRADQQQQLQAQDQIVQADLELLQEREERIRQLEGDILDINDIFKELGSLVHEQGDMINTIEDNVETAYDQVEHGNEQLVKAATYQRKARKKMCILVLILIIAAAILALIIYFSVKKK